MYNLNALLFFVVLIFKDLPGFGHNPEGGKSCQRSESKITKRWIAPFAALRKIAQSQASWVRFVRGKLMTNPVSSVKRSQNWQENENLINSNVAPCYQPDKALC